MKRILLLGNYRPGVGGISGQMEALQFHLQEEGYTVDIISTKGSVWKRLLLPFRLRKEARNYDIIHVHCCSGWGFLPAALGISVARKGNKRVVLTYHGGGAESFFRKHTVFVKHWLLKTDSNIVLSGFLGHVFEQYGIPFKIIPNIIELDDHLFRERDIIEPNYICIRSHEPLYDIPCIMRAFQRVQKHIPAASLTLVGDGSIHKELIVQVTEKGLDNVTFTGRVGNDRIYEYLDKADVMLSSSTVDNMPVSLLEAMNAGLLVISSNVGGVPYMVENNKTGLLFDVGDDEALAGLMMSAIANQEDSKRMIAEAKTRMAQYSWSGVRKQILALYE